MSNVFTQLFGLCQVTLFSGMVVLVVGCLSDLLLYQIVLKLSVIGRLLTHLHLTLRILHSSARLSRWTLILQMTLLIL